MMTKEVSTSLLSSAIQHNNAGVYKMNHGDYEEATKEFSVALKIVRQTVLESQRSGEEKLPAFQQQRSTLKSEPCSFEIHPEDNDVRNPSRFFHKSPLRITSEAVNECSDSCTKLSGIVIFNLALVYYLQGMLHNVEDKEDCLRKSKSFYEKAYTLHLKEKGSVDAIRAVACLNNLAQVNSLLQNETNACRCWKMLLSLIIYLSEAGSMSDNSRTELNNFIGNVTHLILQGAVSAPAA